MRRCSELTFTLLLRGAESRGCRVPLLRCCRWWRRRAAGWRVEARPDARWCAFDRACTGFCCRRAARDAVAVVPPTVPVRRGRAYARDPPSGGPLAGIDAGLRALSVDDGSWSWWCSRRRPACGRCPPSWDLLWGRDSEGVSRSAGKAQPFDQYLMGVYRAGALRRVLDEPSAAAPLRG